MLDTLFAVGLFTSDHVKPNFIHVVLFFFQRPCKTKGNQGKIFSVAFCSPAKSLTFSGLVENPLVKVLTAKQNAPKYSFQHVEVVQGNQTPRVCSSETNSIRDSIRPAALAMEPVPISSMCDLFVPGTKRAKYYPCFFGLLFFSFPPPPL